MDVIFDAGEKRLSNWILRKPSVEGFSKIIERRASWEEPKRHSDRNTWKERLEEEQKLCAKTSAICHMIVLAQRLKLRSRKRESCDVLKKQQEIRKKNNILAGFLEELGKCSEAERRPPEESRLREIVEDLQNQVHELSEHMNLVENYIFFEEENINS